MSAPLKNTYDWLSVPEHGITEKSPLYHKPCGMIGSGGGTAGREAQEHFVNIVKYCQV